MPDGDVDYPAAVPGSDDEPLGRPETGAADASGAPASGTQDDLDTALLGGPRTLTARDVAARHGVEVDRVLLYWRTLGLPAVDPDVRNFTEADAHAFARSVDLSREHGLDLGTVVSLTRALGHTSDRLALWQVEALVEDMAVRYELDDTTARLLVLDRLEELAPVLEAQLVHSWRRQLASIAARYGAEFGDVRGTASDPARLPLARAVGFADMVSFTRRTAGLGSTDLSDFVQRFEAAARDVVAGLGGRVVKTIGDAVLFIADDAATGALIAVGLADAFGGSIDLEAESAPGGLVEGARGVTPVRVGLVWGRVLSRFGDVFGPSVNVAARLTDTAEPSSVLTDPATAQVLAHDPRFTLTAQGERDLAGVGRLEPYRLERAPGVPHELEGLTWSLRPPLAGGR